MILLTVTPTAHPWLVRVEPGARHEAIWQQCRAMPGAEWSRKLHSWLMPIDAARIVVPLLESAGVCKVKWQCDHAGTIGASFTMPSTLREYQQHGAVWLRAMLLREGGALLADEMGLGKSAQAIVALGDVEPVLVVCPAVVRRHWLGQLDRWRGSRDSWSVVSYGQAAKAPQAPWRAVVLDEAHYVSNPQAQRSKAVASLCSATTRPLVLELTGTPMMARPRDLWHPLELAFPGRFGRRWNFEKRYCAGQWVEIEGLDKAVWQADGVSAAAELGARLRHVMLRRTKLEVASDLPALTRQVLEVEIPRSAGRALARAAGALQPGSGSVLGARVSDLLANVESYKLDAACELAQEALASGSRPLLLTCRKTTAHELATRLQAPCVTGDTPADARQALLADAPCGVATMYSVTTGIDLTGYDVVIFCGLDWLPSTLQQAESRAHRLGQARPVSVYYLVGLGTIDEVVRERVIDRLDAASTIIGGDSSGMAQDLGGGSEDALIASIIERITK